MRIFLECGRCRGRYELQISCEDPGKTAFNMTHIVDHIDSNDCIVHLQKLIVELQAVYYETSRPLVEVVEFVNQVKLAASSSCCTITTPQLRSFLS